jgi:probable rRNA maturation factor
VKTEQLTNRALKVLQAENCSQNTEVSVLLTGDETIKILNGQYRGIDETTDVLSFSQHETDEVFPGADDENLLGDIVISVETARRQAEARGFTMDEEIEILLVHGLLHLLGYDHSEPDQAEEMFARQAELLA